jgi:hypothetical protein
MCPIQLPVFVLWLKRYEYNDPKKPVKPFGKNGKIPPSITDILLPRT